ncbi:hypothetical protein HMI54_004867 [Coelomomyces lativittatus]|nr:hypothetical protein HMI54_004867 [Coelomomyces lativittatus]
MVRDLKNQGAFKKAQLEWLCDCFLKVIYHGTDTYQQQQEGKMQIELIQFAKFLALITPWAKLNESELKSMYAPKTEFSVPEVPGAQLIELIFRSFDTDQDHLLSFQDIVNGLNGLIFSDFNERVKLFFELHDADKDGVLHREEIIQLSGSFLFLLRTDNPHDDVYLTTVSNFLQTAFKLAETLPHQDDQEVSYALGTLKATLLTDPVLENLFETGLSNSFKLETSPIQIQVKEDKSVLDSFFKEGQKFATQFKHNVSDVRKKSVQYMKQVDEKRKEKKKKKESPSDNEGESLLEGGGGEAAVGEEQSSQLPSTKESNATAMNVLQEVDKFLDALVNTSSNSNLAPVHSGSTITLANPETSKLEYEALMHDLESSPTDIKVILNSIENMAVTESDAKKSSSSKEKDSTFLTKLKK